MTALSQSPRAGHTEPESPAAAAHPQQRRDRRVLLIVVTVLVTVIVAFVSLSSGSGDISLLALLDAVYARLTGAATADADEKLTIVTRLRLPRTALALLVGAALSIGGVALQGLLRNPLVSPYTLGISPAAAFGASLAILLTSTGDAPGSVSALTILGALLASAAVTLGVLALASNARTSIATLILFGVALSAIFNALTSLIQFVADDQTNARIVRWSFGSLNNASWLQVVTVLIILAVTLPVFFLAAKGLNAISFLGDDQARSLGVRVTVTRTVLIVLSVVMAAVAVSFCGIIGFVGLVGPHIARMLIGADHRFLFPLGAVTGGLLLLTADWVGRTLIAPVVIPVGILVSILGAPLFLYLIFASQRKGGV